MSLPALGNLFRIGQLKAEPRNDVEVKRMLVMARTWLADSQLSNVSPEGRFISAYTLSPLAMACLPGQHRKRKRDICEWGVGLIWLDPGSLDDLGPTHGLVEGKLLKLLGRHG